MTPKNSLMSEEIFVGEFVDKISSLQEDVAEVLLESLQQGNHVTASTAITVLKDLEKINAKFFDRLVDVQKFQEELLEGEDDAEADVFID